MKRIKKNIIRWILTLALLYGVYTETGIFTTLMAFLIAVGIEVNDWSIRQLMSLIRETLHEMRS